MKPCPRECMGSRGVVSAVSPKSYTYGPLVIVGHEVGSLAMIFISLPCILSLTKGRARPEKLLPPPTQPITISGYSPAISNCLRDSRPTTVWCISTNGRTDPKEYLYL